MTDTFASLLQGARVCVFDVASEGLVAFRQWLEEQAVTLLHPPALLFRRFLSTLEGRDLFPSLRIVAIGGDVVLTSDLEKWRRHFSPGCVLFHPSAATETALMTVARVDANTSLESDLTLAVDPVADKGVSVVDEAGQAVEAGEPGELQVSSQLHLPTVTGVGPSKPPLHSSQTPTCRSAASTARAIARASCPTAGCCSWADGITWSRFAATASSCARSTRRCSISRRSPRRPRFPVKLDDEQRLAAFVVLKPGSEFDALALRTRLAAHLPEWKIRRRACTAYSRCRRR